MTAPTPEQMRSLAGDVDNFAADVRIVSAYLRASADEMDRVRAENEHFAGELTAVTANRDHAINVFQRLRAVVENAPHEDDCFAGEWVEEVGLAACICWKADLL